MIIKMDEAIKLWNDPKEQGRILDTMTRGDVKELMDRHVKELAKNK